MTCDELLVQIWVCDLRWAIGTNLSLWPAMSYWYKSVFVACDELLAQICVCDLRWAIGTNLYLWPAMIVLFRHYATFSMKKINVVPFFVTFAKNLSAVAISIVFVYYYLCLYFRVTSNTIFADTESANFCDFPTYSLSCTPSRTKLMCVPPLRLAIQTTTLSIHFSVSCFLARDQMCIVYAHAWIRF